MNEPNNAAAVSSAEAAPPRLPTFSVSQKAEWVEKYLKSGLSLRQFSKQCGVGHRSLHRWVKKQREILEPQRKHSGEAMDFAELKLPIATQCSDWAVELSLPNGTILRLSKDTPPALVDQLLRVC